MFVTLSLLTSLSLLLTLVFTPIVRILAKRANLVDQPDNKRKVHKSPIPRLGGVAIAAAYFGSLLAVALWRHAGAEFSAVLSIAPAAILVFLIGLADDIFDLKPWQKFGVQTIAAVMVVSTGLHLHGMAILAAHPILAAVGTVIWLVGCTNAVNLIDGLDGLAGGISLVATTTILVASLMSGNAGLTIAAAPLAGALLGFLLFNFNPASIFLGDGGSLLLGFMLGCFSLLWSGTFVTLLDLMAPVMTLAVPLSDTTLAITRRFLRGQPIFKADRSHIHHRLLSRGLSHRSTVLFLYAAAATAGLLSLALVSAGYRWQSLVLVVFVLAIALGVRQLRYAEFEAFRRVILRGNIRREIVAQLAVQTLQQELEGAGTVDQCWLAVQNGCAVFGLQAMRMQLAGQIFHTPNHSGVRQSWAMRIPISESDWVELSHNSVPEEYSAALVPFVNTLRRVLALKCVPETKSAEAPAVFAPVLYRTHQSPAA